MNRGLLSPRRALALGIVCIALEGCSALGLGDFDIPSCTKRPGELSACHVLDERDHIPESACAHWQCRQDGRGCELGPKDSDWDGWADRLVCNHLETGRKLDCDDNQPERNPGRVESCDGLDNDCDGVVDEEKLDLVQPPEALGWFDSETLAGRHSLEVSSVQGAASSGDAEPRAHLVSGGRAWLLDLRGGMAPEIAYASAGASTDRPCPRIGTGGPVACNIRQLALSTSPANLLGAAVTDDIGCPGGELRLGVVQRVAAPRLFLGGSRAETPSNLQYGVDVDPSQRCPVVGVQNPSIESMQAKTGEQGFAAWLERAVDDAADSCSEQERTTAIRGIGFWVVPGVQPSLVGTTAGKSQSFGRTSGSAAPALLAIDGDDVSQNGYLLAFGQAPTGLALLRLDPLPTRGDLSPIAVPAPLVVDANDHVDHVSLAVENGPARTEELRVAAAYSAGCAERRSVRLSLFRFANGLASEPENYATLQLAEPGSVGTSAGPFAVYVSSGFVIDDVSGTSSGGWLVLWSDNAQSTIVGSRVTREGRVLDRKPFVVFTEQVDAMTLFNDASRLVSYIAVKQDTRALISAPVLCKVP